MSDKSISLVMSGVLNQKLELVPGNTKKGLRAIGTASDMYMVKPSDVQVIEDFNPRVKDRIYWEGDEDAGIEGIIDLAKSMKQNGYYRHKPLAGFVASVGGKDVVFITEGHRRLDAALYWINNLNGPEDLLVPMVSSPRGTNMLDLNYALYQSNNTEDFRPFEKCIWVKRMHTMYGQTEALIAAKTGLSLSFIRSALIVVSAPDDIAMMVQQGRISVTSAADVVMEHKEKALSVLKQAEANSLADGKRKITARFMPGTGFQKVIQKKSDALFDMVSKVKSDAGYSHLTEETRADLDEMLTAFETIKKELEAKEAEALAAAEQAAEEEAKASTEEQGALDV